jgi:hypothetical protein
VITPFWTWLACGSNQNRAGWRTLCDRWIALHIFVGSVLSLLVSVDPYSFASKALFPAASILVGMSVAWTSRAAAVLQDPAFRKNVLSDERPLEDYLYGYQLSLLIIITMVICVALTANGGIQISWLSAKMATNLTAFFMYFLLSLSIRECWSVINFSNLLSLLHSKM